MPVTRVEVTHVAAPQGLHQPRQAVVAAGRGQQVEVIGHQHIGMEVDPAGLGTVSQQRQPLRPVGVVVCNRLAAVAALDGMVDMMGKSESGKAGHGK